MQRSSVRPFGRRQRSEHGAVAIMVALLMAGLLVAAAMVVDLGVVRIDRQMNKTSADAAVSAGMRGLDQGDGKPHSFAGVCQALAYLKLSQPELAGLPDSGGNVSCPPSETQRKTVCTPTDATTHATYTGATGDGRIQVTIKSPYDVTEGGFAEESMTTFANDTGAAAQGGCDQLGVIIDERQTPGFGRIATDRDFTSRIRSVGRVTVDTKGQGAVALLLLNRDECEVLRNASNNTRILVRGNGPVPGIIHSDSLASTSCNSTKVFYSQPDYGIIAEESEDPPTVPGIITTRALSGEAGAVPANAEGLFPKVVAKPDPGGATGHGLITRSVVDEAYLAGVREVRARANALLDSTTPPVGFTDVTSVGTGNSCTLGPARQALPGKIWIDCGNVSGTYTFPEATEVIIRGRVSGDLSLPKATRVYIEGTDSPYGLSAGNFRMHHFGASTCPTTNVASRAQLVIRHGALKNANSSSQIQMCNTAVVLLGGPTSTNALPADFGQSYTSNSLSGHLQITNLNTGTVRWTAPDAVGEEERTADDFRQLEDLALWTESSGSSHQLSGTLYMAGVFMLPNAKPFNINGNGDFFVENSQFVVDKLNLTGSGILEMRPDPHDSITISVIGGFGLVR